MSAAAHDEFASVLGGGRGSERPGELHPRDRQVIDSFCVGTAASGRRLETRFGRARGFGTPIGVLWLDGAPVLDSHGEHSEQKVSVFMEDPEPGSYLDLVKAALQASGAFRYIGHGEQAQSPAVSIRAHAGDLNPIERLCCESAVNVTRNGSGQTPLTVVNEVPAPDAPAQELAGPSEAVVRSLCARATGPEGLAQMLERLYPDFVATLEAARVDVLSIYRR